MKHTSLALLILLPFSLNAAEGKIDMHGGKETTLLPATHPHKAKIFYATILEIKPVMGYQYLKVNENGKIKWVAINDAPVRVGDKIGYDKRTVMKDFKSKALHKTFKEIIFANDLYLPQKATAFGSLKDTLMRTKDNTNAHKGIGMSPQPKDEKPSKPFVKKDSYRVEEVHMWRKSLNKKTITVIGKVYKVAKGIMKRDWVHIGDGTGSEKKLNDDLVFTTTNANIKRADRVKATGVVAVDKDFGYGYFYPVILEHAHFEYAKK